MNKTFELLAPGGDIDSIKAAIAAGADAVYCGLNKFNARNRAANISLESLNGIVHLAHNHRCKVFLTLNVIVVQAEIPHLVSVLNTLANTNIDGVIVQDLGVFYLLSTHFKHLPIHASTQLNTHNEGQIEFLHRLNATRVNLSRELNIHEITSLTSVSHHHNMLTEVFVHGSYCISFSGLCYISSVLGGRSGNRGRCSQPCRDRYMTTPQGKEYPLNMKDNSAFFDVDKLAGAGVDSLKIEGRMKQCDYVYTVVDCWRNHLRILYDEDRVSDGNHDLYKVFNRDFSNGYLTGRIHKDMFIDSPRDHSIEHLSNVKNYATPQDLAADRIGLFEEKVEIITDVKRRIDRLSTDPVPLRILISGAAGSPLTISVNSPDRSFTVRSETHLACADPGPDKLPRQSKHKGMNLCHDEIVKRLDFLNHTEYVIDHLYTDELQERLSISFKEFTAIKDRIFSLLNDSKDRVRPVDVPTINKHVALPVKPALAILISSPGDVSLCHTTSADVYYLLPNALEHNKAELCDLFLNNTNLIPWFPSVLIGDNYTAGVEFLHNVKPRHLVTDNTGIAYEAFKKGISWIAGPHLNSANSFSLLCLHETFNCHGAFISNEISKKQLKGLHAPENFNLYYSIYHPLMLLISRQCLFQQVAGCHKDGVDEGCLQRCSKSATLTTVNNETLLIEKTNGNYPCIHHPNHYLNTDILRDFPDMFSHVLIDLRDVHTETIMQTDKAGIIRLFELLLDGHSEAEQELRTMVSPTTNAQYKKGI